MIKELSAHEVQDDDIVEGIMTSLMEKKIQKVYPEFSYFTGGQFKASKMHYKSKVYKELQQKFSAWVCLCKLDFMVTVSFRGYESI